MKIPVRIKELQNQKGLKQTEVAAKKGITQSSYANIENSKTILTIVKLENIDRTPGVEFSYLVLFFTILFKYRGVI